MMFALLFCAGFWITVIAAGPRGNGLSLALALTAIVSCTFLMLAEGRRT